MKGTKYLAAVVDNVGRDPRARTHAVIAGTQHALCAAVAVVPRFPERPFDPADDRACVRCAKAHQRIHAQPGERTQRANYEQRKRARFIDQDDPAIRAFMLALHTGGINNSRGNFERGTETMGSYVGIVKRLHRAVGFKPWGDIDPAEIHAFLYGPKANGEPKAFTTINQNHTALSTFFNFCLDREFIHGRSPMRHVGRPRPTEDTEDLGPGRLPAEQDDWDAVMDSYLPVDDLLALGFMYFEGLRISEVTIVRPPKVNPLRREMDFWRPKSRMWQEDFPYGEYVDGLRLALPERAAGAERWLDAVEYMTKYRQGEDTLVVSGSINEPEDWWGNRLEHHILPKAGLRPDAFTPHRLRHNFGHNMIDAGMDPFELQEAMGHKSIETTQLYTKHVKRAKKWADRVKANATAQGEVVALRRAR